jgi:DNA-binding MurR/RpiR family transcriptional regulator
MTLASCGLPDPVTPEGVRDRLSQALPAMSPQLRKAARYVLDHPNEVGIGSIREIAVAAGVKPNTLVRMARAVGFEGYEDLRMPFRESLRAGHESFPDRARWLQSLAKGGRHGGLISEMAATTIENIEQLFAGITLGDVKSAADSIVAARTTYVLGIGISHALANNFAYLARMALDNVVAVPRDGSLPIDDIARIGRRDVLLAMTFKPYRSEVVDAVRCAAEQGAKVIGLTDSRSSPIALAADQAFVIPTETPQFFTSTVAAAALLETIMAFVIADADPKIIESIDHFHRRRFDLGVYWTEE